MESTTDIELVDRSTQGDVQPENNQKSRPAKQYISNFETMVHLLKGNIGTGIFAIPEGFRNAGMVVGSVGIPIIAVIVIHCMHILVKCASVITSRKNGDFLDYAQVFEEACTTGPKSITKYSVWVRNIINVFLCVTQLGFCCVYIVFVANNLREVVEHYAPDFQVAIQVYMAMLTVPLIFLSWIRNLKFLSPVSLLANLLQSASLIIVFYYSLQGLPSVSTLPAFASWSTLPLYFGTVVFAFLGISLILPLQNDMNRPQDFGGFTGVLNTGMMVVTLLYFAMGFYGYLKYGDDIKGSITLNLPQDEILAQMVKLMMVLAIFGSYVIQFYVPVAIMWPTLSTYVKRRKLIAELAFRTGLVLLTFGLAALIPKLDLFISLVGAFSSSFLALVFPPILEIITYWPKASKWLIAKDALIMLFGIIVFSTGTYSSIDAIVASFGQDD